ncbi:FAD-dependent oxidoreductase [Botrimarina sp.]|uniref:NAD(P)/FAD-dependent oxidoreductase n=1 Tax=Botrimarina sp. TaxID=2795802 RepID=UPI0032F0987E
MPEQQILADTVAVIGGGVAGLAAARRLAAEGVDVTVFDKGRGVGGRTSTRYADGARQFDHGAQYFTVRSKALADQLEAWIAAGVAAEWTGRLAVIECHADGCHLSDPPGPKQRFVGTPGMNAPAKQLAEELTAAGGRIESGVRVAPLKRSHGRWGLRSESGDDLGDYAKVLVTAPAPQAAELLTPSPALSNAAKSVSMSACWSAMVAFDDPVAFGAPDQQGDLAGAFVNGPKDFTALSWIARDSSKPGRPEADDRWVLHGSPEWSEANVDIEADQAAASLLESFWKATGAAPRQPAYLAAHRWRHALPAEPLGDRRLADAGMGLFAAGDWCGGPKFEGAFLSGLAAADAILNG